MAISNNPNDLNEEPLDHSDNGYNHFESFDKNCPDEEVFLFTSESVGEGHPGMIQFFFIGPISKRLNVKLLMYESQIKCAIKSVMQY